MKTKKKPERFAFLTMPDEHTPVGGSPDGNLLLLIAIEGVAGYCKHPRLFLPDAPKEASDQLVLRMNEDLGLTKSDVRAIINSTFPSALPIENPEIMSLPVVMAAASLCLRGAKIAFEACPECKKPRLVVCIEGDYRDTTTHNCHIRGTSKFVCRVCGDAELLRRLNSKTEAAV